MQEKIQLLQKIIPECFTEGTLDVEKLKRNLGYLLDSSDEKYSFSWSGRNDTFKVILALSRGTLIPNKQESIDFDQTNNLFLEGENLEILKLLRKTYSNKIKMIYIDPPYNTGKDFIYSDNFQNSINSYLEQTQQIKDGIKLTTNPETSGRFHSDWISFMYARLSIAKDFLRDDGLIFISISDDEIHHLRMIMDDIFGEDNFIGNIIWNSTKSVTNTALISVGHTYNLVYAKNKEYFIKNRTEFRLNESGQGFENPDDDPRGPWKADPFQVGGWRPNQQYEILFVTHYCNLL